jgi:integrase
MVKFNVVQAWIDNVAYSHSKSAGTERNYRTALNRFCSFIESSPEQIVADYQTMNEKEFRRHYAEYLRALIGDMTTNGFASTTINVAVAGVRSFFKYNDLPLGFIPVGKNRVKFHNRDIKKEEIEAILKLSKPRDRAFFCMMAQTGLRPSTIANLRLKHVEPEFSKGFNPCKIDVPEELSKGEYGTYFTFMPDETIKHLKTYLMSRGKLGPEDWLFTCEGVDKKLNVKSMAGLFFRAVNKIGLADLEQKAPGKPRNVRLYCLRKFFRKYAGQAGADYVNFWMGHLSSLGVDLHYFSHDVEFHRKIYIEKAMPNLRIESPTPLEHEVIIKQQLEEIEKLRRDRDAQTEKLKDYLEMIHTQGKQIDEYGKRADEERKAIELHGKQLEELKKLIEKKQRQ